MPVAPSFDDLIAQYEAEALAGRPDLMFLEGDITTAQQHGAGAIGDACVRHTVQSFKETFIDGAKGDALTALVDDHLNLQRQPATPAQSAVTFARTSGGAAFSLSVGFVVGTDFDAAGNTVLYTLDTIVNFGLADNGPHIANVTAQVVGKAGNVAASKIVRIVDDKPDPTLTCTNAAVAAGGNDQESDEELRVRARLFWQTLRRGTLAALEFGALQVPAVRISKATEDPSTGLVTLVVTDSDGGSTAQMVADTIAEIENWRAAGSIVTVIGGTALIVDVTGTLIGKTGVDTAVLGVPAAEAITGRMRKQKQGETLYIDSIKAAAIGVDPDALEALTLSTPLVDVEPTAYQVIRPGTITIT